MLEVNVQHKNHEDVLIEPISMFGFPEGTIFQQYFNGQAQKWYYINCGINEALLQIWFNDDDNQYHLSHELKSTIRQLLKTVRVKKVDLKLTVSLG